MTDFYLHKYTTNESITNGIVAPHKYRHPLIVKMGKQQDCLTAWNKDKEKITNSYVVELKKLFNTNDKFLLFTPPTNTKIFVNDIIDKVKKEFPNIVDLTHCFDKTRDVNFGDQQYDSHSTKQLASMVQVDNDKLKGADKDIKIAFIIDDVNSTGKSLELTTYLITESLGTDIEIKSGVILTTT